MLDLKLPASFVCLLSVCLLFFPFLLVIFLSSFLPGHFSIPLGGSGSYLNIDINRTPLTTRSSGNGELEGRRDGAVHTHSQLEMGVQLWLLPLLKPREKCCSFPWAFMGPQAFGQISTSTPRRKDARKLLTLPDSLFPRNWLTYDLIAADDYESPYSLLGLFWCVLTRK